MIFEIICTRTYALTIVTEHESHLNYPRTRFMMRAYSMKSPFESRVRSFDVSHFEQTTFGILISKLQEVN
jgi:hypothetical protein